MLESMFYESQVFLFLKLVDSIMQVEDFFLLAISVSVNLCVAIYCVCVRIQTHINKKCSCGRTGICVFISHAFAETPSELAKIVTEQTMLWLQCVLSIVAMCISGIWYSPFHSSIESKYVTFIQILLASFVGKYVYMIAQNLFLLRKSNVIRFRIDIIHHVTTITCYCVFIFNKENFLLALIGMTMELNTSVIEYAKLRKKTGQKNKESYKRLTVISCTVTVAFRGVVPLTFLVISMFRETPFGMSYVTVTVFFISLIFFSVINVWLVLMSVQRLIKAYSSHGLLNDQDPKHYHRNITPPSCFEKNNLGYMRSYANRNLSSKEDEKINTAKKEFMKNDLNTVVTNAIIIRPTNHFSRSNSSLTNSTGSNSADLLRQLSVYEQEIGRPDVTRMRGLSDGDLRINRIVESDRSEVNVRQLRSESDVHRLRTSDSSNSSSTSNVGLVLNLHGNVEYTPH